MAHNSTWSSAARTSMLNGEVTDFNSGYLRLYDGAQPAGPDTGISTQNLLATLRFPATAFTSVTAGVATAGTMVSDPNATGGANPVAWYRAFKSDGTTALSDGTVGTSGTNCILAATTIVAGAVVAVTSLTVTLAASSAQ